MPIEQSGREPTKFPGVFKLGPKRYQVVVQWVDPRTGKRKKKEAIKSTLAEALAFRATAEKVDTEKRTRQRFADYAEHWLKLNGPRMAPSSQQYYANNIAHANLALGPIFVDALRPADIRQWIAKASRAASTRNGWLRVVRQILDDVVADGILPSNPAKAVKSLPEGRTKGRRGRALSLKEFQVFLTTVEKMAGDDLSEDVARMLLTVAWTGVRRGELLALKWSDYVEGELRVERSVWRRQEKETKTDDPRLVVVVEPLAEILAAQRRWLVARQHAGLHSGLMFPASEIHARTGAARRGVDEVSWFRGSEVLHKPLRKLWGKEKLPEFSIHALRRTWENLLRTAGVDHLVRRSMAGWRTEEAQAIYASVDRQERDAAASSVVALVMGK
jgi:integrase